MKLNTMPRLTMHQLIGLVGFLFMTSPKVTEADTKTVHKESIIDPTSIDHIIKEFTANGKRDLKKVSTVDGLNAKNYKNKLYVFLEDLENKDRNHRFDRTDGAKPECIILHHTECPFSASIGIPSVSYFFASGQPPQVNAHFVITEREKSGVPGGAVVQMLAVENLARHAGPGTFRGKSTYNNHSIGIELINRGDNQCLYLQFIAEKYPELYAKALAHYEISKHPVSKKYIYRYDEEQLRALAQLLEDLCRLYNIPKYALFSHSDIAPNRKSDVHILFPWKKFYLKYGFGMWLSKKELAVAKKMCRKNLTDIEILFEIKKELLKFGYVPNSKTPQQEWSVDEWEKTFQAFYAHFSRNGLANRWKGAPDRNDLVWAIGLAKKYPWQ